MKVTKKEIGLLIALGGILIGVISYFLVMTPLQDDAKALRGENKTLSDQVAVLEKIKGFEETYNSEVARMNEEIDMIYKVFPSDVRQEDAIVLSVNQELAAPIVVNTVTISPLDLVVFADEYQAEKVKHTYDYDEILGDLAPADEPVSSNAPSDEAIAMGEGAQGLLLNRQVTIDYKAPYDGIKAGLKNIAAQVNRMSVNNITLAFDETTGLIAGSAAIDMYCIYGQEGKPYVSQNLSAVLLGTDNPFGTSDKTETYEEVIDIAQELINEEATGE